MRKTLLFMMVIVTALAVFAGCTYSIDSDYENFIPIKSIVVEDVPTPVNVGDQIQFHCLVTPEDATNQYIYWTSDNSYCVAVNSDGLAQAYSPGTAIISAMSYDGLVHSIRIEVQ